MFLNNKTLIVKIGHFITFDLNDKNNDGNFAKKSTIRNKHLRIDGNWTEKMYHQNMVHWDSMVNVFHQQLPMAKIHHIYDIFDTKMKNRILVFE